MSPRTSPDARPAKSSRLPALICIAALRSEFSRSYRLGFACECINSLQRTRSASRIRYQRQGNSYDDNCRRPPYGPRHWQLAYAAGDHRLRLRYRLVELRAPIELRLFRSADEPGVFVGPRRLRPRACRSKPVVGAGPAGCRRDRRPVRRLARDVCRRRSLRRRSPHDALRGDAASDCPAVRSIWCCRRSASCCRPSGGE